MTYNGLAMVVEKRRSHGWQAFGSYTFSRTAGLQPWSGATAAGAQVSTVAPPPAPQGVTFGRDPNDLVNARGRLAQRSPAHVQGDGQRGCAADRHRVGRQPGLLQRQTVGGHRADHPCGRIPNSSGFSSSRAVRGGSPHKRCWICASRSRCRLERTAHRADPGRTERAQQRGRGERGHGQSGQSELRPPQQLHRSAPRDDQRSGWIWAARGFGAARCFLASRIGGSENDEESSTRHRALDCSAITRLRCPVQYVDAVCSIACSRMEYPSRHQRLPVSSRTSPFPARYPK